MRDDVTDSRNYMKKCTKDVAKTLLSVTLHSVEKMTVKSQCKLRTEKRRFLSFSNCGNTGHKEIAKCWQNNTKRITAININGTKSNTKIPLMCWSVNQLIYKTIASIMKTSIALLLSLISQYSDVSCVEFIDCGSVDGKVTSIVVQDCGVSDDYCPLHIGKTASIDMKFTASIV